MIFKYFCSILHQSINPESCILNIHLHQELATGRWFFPGTLVSSTNKTDRHDITEILLKVALNTLTQTL